MSKALFAVPDVTPIPVPIEEPTDGDGGDLSLDDLMFLSQRIMLTAISKVNWSNLQSTAAMLVEDEGDVRTIVKLMENAQIEVTIGGAV